MVRIFKHELARSKCGSFEVRFSDGRPGVFFYWDDVFGCQLSEDRMTSEQALEQARALARAERDKAQDEIHHHADLRRP
jgi:hypothetical protein